MSSQVINSPKAPKPIGPYNQAILAGNTLYCSGQVSINPENGKLVMEDVASETHQVMKNLKAVLAEAEMHFKDVVKCSIFLKRMTDYAAVNAVYGVYFTDNFPARETVQVAALPLNVNVEISLIAVKAD